MAQAGVSANAGPAAGAWAVQPRALGAENRLWNKEPVLQHGNGKALWSLSAGRLIITSQSGWKQELPSVAAGGAAGEQPSVLLGLGVECRALMCFHRRF